MPVWTDKNMPPDYRWWFAWRPITGWNDDGVSFTIWLKWVKRKKVTTYPTGRWDEYTVQNFYIIKNPSQMPTDPIRGTTGTPGTTPKNDSSTKTQ
jgi:hypothetical protein